MGHAAHFLRRLDRLADREVELALRLYNDPELLGATLARAKLPDSAERVAIALEHPQEGPFLVVTRTGRFVTCLGRGMYVSGTPIVTREQLDGAARHVERMRETIAQTRFFDQNSGLLRKKFQALYAAGPYVSREQFEDVARWEPLLGAMCLNACVGTATDLLDAREPLKDITRPHPRHEERLRAYFRSFYACAHLYVLSGISLASRECLAKIVGEHEGLTWSWTGVRYGVGYLLDRALWSTARMGKVLLPGQKRRLRGELTFLGLIDGMVGTAVIGLAHEKVRAEARKMLRAPRDVMQEDPRTEHLGKLLDVVLDLCFDDPAAVDAFAVQMGRELLFPISPHLPERYRWERAEDVPADLARTALVNTSDAVLAEAERIAHAFWLLPWIARAEPGELYLPGDIVDAIRQPWSQEQSIELLEMQRVEYGVRAPAKTQKSAGRNDPCPCSSGKKYKRCCGK